MPRKKQTPEPVPELPISRQTFDTLEDVIFAIDRIASSVEARLARNHREKSMLDSAKIKLQIVRNALSLVNTIALEPAAKV